jgi:hypothetical protein
MRAVFTMHTARVFLQVLPTVAAMGGGKYAPALARHLLENKLRHWEPSLRQLGAQALVRI